jgi:hypothetical protein
MEQFTKKDEKMKLLKKQVTKAKMATPMKGQKLGGGSATRPSSGTIRLRELSSPGMVTSIVKGYINSKKTK